MRKIIKLHNKWVWVPHLKPKTLDPLPGFRAPRIPQNITGGPCGQAMRNLPHVAEALWPQHSDSRSACGRETRLEMMLGGICQWVRQLGLVPRHSPAASVTGPLVLAAPPPPSADLPRRGRAKVSHARPHPVLLADQLTPPLPHCRFPVRTPAVLFKGVYARGKKLALNFRQMWILNHPFLLITLRSSHI